MKIILISTNDLSSDKKEKEFGTVNMYIIYRRLFSKLAFMYWTKKKIIMSLRHLENL